VRKLQVFYVYLGSAEEVSCYFL